MSTDNAFPNPLRADPKRGEPAWDLALMYPLQGSWSVEDYLRLNTSLLVEYTDGFVRVLPMPSILHQWIVRFLFEIINAYVSDHRLGEVFFAPLPVALGPTVYREPDLIYVRPHRIQSMSKPVAGADLVVEVVSDGEASRKRDYEEKRREYAEAGIAEYWIVDPQGRMITVLVLDGQEYREHGEFRVGDVATSPQFPGLEIAVDAAFAKCE